MLYQFETTNIKLGNLNVSDTGGGTSTIIEEKVVEGVQQNVVVGEISTQTLNTSNFLAANVVANVSLQTNSSKVFLDNWHFPYNRPFSISWI